MIMERTTRRKRLTVSLPDYAMADIRKEAARTGWSMSALGGEYLLDGMYSKPNAETLAAIEEARSGVEMGDFDPDELDKYIYAAEEIDAV